jgi:hypothetical protein
MFHACRFGDVPCDFVSHGNLGTAIDKEEFINAFKGRRQSRRVGEVPDEHVDAIAEAQPRLVLVTHEYSRPLAASEYEFDDP